MEKVKSTSTIMIRSPCADDEFRANERAERVKLMDDFLEVSADAKIEIRKLQKASAAAEKTRQNESLEPKPNLNSTMIPASTCPLRYDCKDIIQRISKFEGDPTKFQRFVCASCRFEVLGPTGEIRVLDQDGWRESSAKHHRKTS